MRPAGLLIMLLFSFGSGRRSRAGRVVRGIGGRVVEADLAPGIERLLQRAAELRRAAKDLSALVPDVTALVARLDHRLERHAIGHRAGLNTRWVSDGAAAELQYHVVTEQIEQLMHLAGVNAARGDRHDLADVGPVLGDVHPGRPL